MKMFTTILALLLIVAFTGASYAVPPGKTAEFSGGAMGKVTFDGKIHADKGMKCNDCHTKIFQMKRDAKPKMADHKSDKFCFSCHNGAKAFATDGNCTKCHKK
jgi:c(7)-type cytochrome triheme protein